MTGPVTPPPPPGPGRDEPYDPNTPEGREVAARLTRTLAAIEMELAAAEAQETSLRSAA
ncbi:hypothetical protein [Actinoplanes teichomyceticus]|uniref:Uncharacterized protein n=1 Tax=Actinoplanes teichomyceticus TaxID=1867 RepID=A0A561WAZ3_ACTTI|nr:hypothetical protein [Actinoplanes teichomyceticus]TWG21015.1 hypothetical protein FHX34_103544 [Actinoplanes teichomyceticus]